MSGETGTARRADLATFLRSRRARLRPHEVGLPGGGRRRTPGLRRQEVAQLAGLSVEYYIRLEQGRGPHPSGQVLSALARSLLLTRDERDYLFRVAGQSPPPVAAPSREVSPAIRQLLDSLSEVPAYLLDATYEVLAWNDLATHFIGDLSAVPEPSRNMLRWIFGHPDSGTRWSEPETVAFARGCVADLRAAYARYPGDTRIADLVTELLGLSARFAAMWAEHEVEERRPTVKRMVHPLMGPVEFECQVLDVPGTGQRLVVYCPAAGSPAQAAFAGLARHGGSPEPARA